MTSSVLFHFYILLVINTWKLQKQQCFITFLTIILLFNHNFIAAK